MKNKKYLLLSVCVIVSVVIIISVIYNLSQPISEGSRDCVVDSDCVVFGEDGDCNCGCYNENDLPSGSGGACFCAAPKSCECVEGVCEGKYN